MVELRNTTKGLVDHRRIVSGMRFMESAEPTMTVEASQLSPEEFQWYVNGNRPLIIKGAASHWPALRQWPQDTYLIERTKGQTVNICPHINYMTKERNDVERHKVTFQKAWETLHQTSEQPAAVLWPISNIKILPAPAHVYENLKEDIRDFQFLPNPPSPYLYPRLRGFIYRNAGTCWHYHETDCTLMTQIKGRKTIGMLPSDKKTWDTVFDPFMKDLYFTDLNCFGPHTQDLKPQIGVVETGDAAFLPPFWWHGVEAIDGFGITVPYCWRPPLHVVGNLNIPANYKFLKSILLDPRPLSLIKLLMAAGVGASIAKAIGLIAKRDKKGGL